MNSDLELKNHIICEFLIRNNTPTIITETRGVVNGIDDVVNTLTKAMLPQAMNVSKGIEGNSSTEIYNDSNILSSIKTFFNDFNIRLKIIKSQKKQYHGGTAVDSIFYNLEEKRWYCHPDINLTIGGPTINDIIYVLKFCLGHELTHCYNLLQYAIKTNNSPWMSVSRNRYPQIIDGKNNGFLRNEKAISDLLYKLNRMERNAYLAQLRQELMERKEELKDNNIIFNVIKTTESYQKFLNLEHNINILLTIDSQDIQVEIINILNRIMGLKFKTFNQAKKYLVRRWMKWKKIYLSKAAKIGYDVYLTTPNGTWLDWGMIGNEINLKP